MASGFLYIASFLAAVVSASWLVSHWKHHRPPIQSEDSNKEISPEPLPATLQNADPDLKLLVRAMHDSVKRYKHLYEYCHKHGYQCTARSKRYELRISLTRSGVRKFLLNVVLEGKHPHEFDLDFTALGSSRLYNAASAITKNELAPYLKPLSFFTKVQVRPSILSAEKTVRSEESMQNWPKALSGFVRLGNYLMDSELRKEILEAVDVLCPYCREEFSQREATVSCRDCKTRHHKDCWEEVGKCSVFGCNSKKEFAVNDSLTN